MSILDVEVIRFLAPWIGLGFAANLILGFLLDVRGAVVAFGLGAIAPILVYFPSIDFPPSIFPSGAFPSSVSDLVEVVLRLLRAPIPFYFQLTGVSFLLELTLSWWLGGAFGAALAIYARRRRRPN